MKNYAQSSKSIIWLAAATLLLGIAIFLPKILHPLNKLWIKFGKELHNIMTPIVMGIIFFGVFTPFGIIGRLFGWDPLRLKCDKSLKSYWIEKKPNETGTLYNQF